MVITQICNLGDVQGVYVLPGQGLLSFVSHQSVEVRVGGGGWVGVGGRCGGCGGWVGVGAVWVGGCGGWGWVGGWRCGVGVVSG